MKTEYKYWFYYINDNDNYYSLYAYTDNKDLVESFEMFRDMNKFKIKKSKISKEEVNYLAREEMGKYLKFSTLEVYDKETKCFGSMQTALTMNEETTIHNLINNINCGMLCRYCWIDPLIFNDDLLYNLYILRYTDYNEYISSKKDNKNLPSIRADELSIFIRYFGKTLKSI